MSDDGMQLALQALREDNADAAAKACQKGFAARRFGHGSRGLRYGGQLISAELTARDPQKFKDVVDGDTLCHVAARRGLTNVGMVVVDQAPLGLVNAKGETAFGGSAEALRAFDLSPTGTTRGSPPVPTNVKRAVPLQKKKSGRPRYGAVAKVAKPLPAKSQEEEVFHQPLSSDNKTSPVLPPPMPKPEEDTWRPAKAPAEEQANPQARLRTRPTTPEPRVIVDEVARPRPGYPQPPKRPEEEERNPVLARYKLSSRPPPAPAPAAVALNLLAQQRPAPARPDDGFQPDDHLRYVTPPEAQRAASSPPRRSSTTPQDIGDVTVTVLGPPWKNKTPASATAAALAAAEAALAAFVPTVREEVPGPPWKNKAVASPKAAPPPAPPAASQEPVLGPPWKQKTATSPKAAPPPPPAPAHPAEEPVLGPPWKMKNAAPAAREAPAVVAGPPPPREQEVLGPPWKTRSSPRGSSSPKNAPSPGGRPPTHPNVATPPSTTPSLSSPSSSSFSASPPSFSGPLLSRRLTGGSQGSFQPPSFDDDDSEDDHREEEASRVRAIEVARADRERELAVVRHIASLRRAMAPDYLPNDALRVVEVNNKDDYQDALTEEEEEYLHQQEEEDDSFEEHDSFYDAVGSPCKPRRKFDDEGSEHHRHAGTLDALRDRLGRRSSPVKQAPVVVDEAPPPPPVDEAPVVKAPAVSPLHDVLANAVRAAEEGEEAVTSPSARIVDEESVAPPPPASSSNSGRFSWVQELGATAAEAIMGLGSPPSSPAIVQHKRFDKDRTRVVVMDIDVDGNPSPIKQPNPASEMEAAVTSLEQPKALPASSSEEEMAVEAAIEAMAAAALTNMAGNAAAPPSEDDDDDRREVDFPRRRTTMTDEEKNLKLREEEDQRRVAALEETVATLRRQLATSQLEAAEEQAGGEVIVPPTNIIQPKRPVQKTLAEIEADLREATMRCMNGGMGAERDLELLTVALKTHPDYHAREKQKEKLWDEEQREANSEALLVARGFVPEDVTRSSFEKLGSDLLKAGCQPKVAARIARRLWTTQCLWLVRMHPHQISTLHAADLRGRYAVQGLDILELRALYAALPPTFDADGDGSKRDWRNVIRNKLIAQLRKSTLSPVERRHPAYAGAPDQLFSSRDPVDDFKVDAADPYAHRSH